MDQLNLRYGPESDSLAWCRKADKLITVEDVKYVLSSTYQGTPYSTYSNSPTAKLFRPIGINRTAFCSLAEIRNDVPEEIAAIEWLAFASNVYNAFVPLYTNIDKVPAYLGDTTLDVNTNSFYWNCRLLSALGDAQHDTNLIHIERYQDAVEGQTRYVLDEGLREFKEGDNAVEFCNKQDQIISDIVEKLTAQCLNNVLFEDTCLMRNGYNRSDN